MTRVSGVSAIVLHTRAYRESSLLVNLLTAEYGRVAGVANGVRRGARGHCFQPFFQLALGWSGRGSLVTLSSYEVETSRIYHGDLLASAYYVCELINRLTREREALPRLFGVAAWTLDQLLEHTDVAPALRVFERILLEEIGYGLDFTQDASGTPLDPQCAYRLVPEVGFMIGDGDSDELIPGRLLLDIGANRFADPHARRAALTLYRGAIQPHLGDTPLISRQMLAHRSHEGR
jgi:DNA repair protein RecO (recombination protein O)